MATDKVLDLEVMSVDSSGECTSLKGFKAPYGTLVEDATVDTDTKVYVIRRGTTPNNFTVPDLTSADDGVILEFYREVASGTSNVSATYDGLSLTNVALTSQQSLRIMWGDSTWNILYTNGTVS